MLKHQQLLQGLEDKSKKELLCLFLMIKEKIIIPSNEETLNFSREYYPKNHILRKKYNHPFLFFSYRKQLPCFLSDDTAQHHQDIKNIEHVLRRRKIKEEELSVIVFDAHTDMYIHEDLKEEKIRSLQGDDHMANWIFGLIKRGYKDISILGVSDFTRSCPEREGYEYFRFADKVKFFLGRDFNRELDFKEETYKKTPLMKLEDFFKKPLKDYSFISLDCDVSEDFAGHPMQTFTGYRGETKIDEIIDAIKYCQKNSQIIGFSLYGIYGGGFFSTFLNKKEAVRKILDNI